jgi:integrase
MVDNNNILSSLLTEAKTLDNDANLKQISILLGHRSVQQTADTYQHTSKRLAEDAVGKLPSILADI